MLTPATLLTAPDFLPPSLFFLSGAPEGWLCDKRPPNPASERDRDRERGERRRRKVEGVGAQGHIVLGFHSSHTSLMITTRPRDAPV